MEVDYSSSKEYYEKIISTFELIQYPRVLFSGFSSFMAFMSLSSSLPILVGQILGMGAGYNIVALLCAIQPVGFIISTIIYRYIPEDVQKVDIILFSNLLIVGAYLLSGPCELFSSNDFSQNLRALFTGHILKALIVPFIFLPVLPEMIQSVQFEYNPDQKE
jgi:hypothetical protein